MKVMLLLVIGIIFEGFTFSMLWEWFIVSTFKVPVLTISNAIGIIILKSLLLLKYKKPNNYEESESDEEDIEIIMYLIKSIAFTLFSGFIIKQFM